MSYVPVILGSVRRGRNTGRLARFLEARLRARDGVETELLDLRELNLPLLEERRAHLDDVPAGLARFGESVDRADAVVITTPEYNKGYPAALKNAIDALGPEWRHKPIGIAAHSVGAFGGTVVLQQLRVVMLGVRALPIPAAITCPFVERAFEHDGTPLDDAWPERGDRFLDELLGFGEAISAARPRR